MRLAISNIAWETHEDEAVLALLKRYKVDAIDIAPGKYFPEPAQASFEQISSVKQWWAERGIEITGMQALLFGTSGLNVFGAPDIQDAMLQHLDAVCRIGAGLGAVRLVFGSPKNRDRSALSDAETVNVATAFFRRLGDIALKHGVVVCLEPNPTRYGANFMTNCADTARIVEAVDHASIRMQFDTGALTINDEQADTVLRDCAHLIGHIHASEPDLVPLGDGGTDHARMAAALKQKLPRHIVSIEMLATRHETHTAAIERALKVATRHYRAEPDGSPQ